MKIKYILACAVAALSAISCNSLLDIPQHGVLNYDDYYQTDEEAETGVNAIYLQMRGLDYNCLMGKNMLTDDFWAGGGVRNDNAELEQLNEFTFGIDQSFLQGMFTGYYQLIYKCNVVLGHVGTDSDIKNRCRAEAKVFRAWAYFELISMWGNPPLVDHELTPSEYSRPNGTTEELWGLVEKDLNEAIESGLLPEKANADDQSVWRVTKQFAQAVLGKAYLWQGKYPEAAEVLDEVINSGLYKLYTGPYEDIIAFDNKMNCESLFESVRVDDSNNPYDNFSFSKIMIHWRTDKMNVSADMATTGWGFLNPRKSLYEDFVAEEGEDGYRLNNTLKTYPQIVELGNSVNVGKYIINEGYFMWKWRVQKAEIPTYGMGGAGMATIDNPRWMRYAEVLLLASEANLMAGNQGKADEYLNQVRERAQLAPKSGITLEDIQIEKRLELCGEGTRFQDMIRWGIAEERMKDQGKNYPMLDSNGSVSYVETGADPSSYGFKSKHNLLPYPGVEIRLNSNITQNPGWE